MIITAVESFVVDIPFAHPFVVWRGAVPSKEHVLVRIETDSSIVGWGEASPFLYYAPETSSDIHTIISGPLRDDLLGKDPRDIRRIRAELDVIDGHNFAKAAIETALWDILSRSVGIPLYRLLGGPVRDSVPIVAIVQSGNPDDMAIEARDLVRRGFRRLKIKIGFGPELDEAMVARVREAVGTGPSIRIDAEEAFHTKDAIQLGRRLEKYGIELFSQPVARTDWHGMVLLRANIPMPLLADEGIHSPEDVLQCVRIGAADMVNIKVLKSGGLLGSLEMASICRSANLPVVVGSMVESGIGSLFGAHFAVLVAGLAPTELCGPLLFKEDLLDTPMRIKNGNLHLGDQPGLGAGVALDSLEKYRVRTS